MDRLIWRRGLTLAPQGTGAPFGEDLGGRCLSRSAVCLLGQGASPGGDQPGPGPVTAGHPAATSLLPNWPLSDCDAPTSWSAGSALGSGACLCLDLAPETLGQGCGGSAFFQRSLHHPCLFPPRPSALGVSLILRPASLLASKQFHCAPTAIFSLAIPSNRSGFLPRCIAATTSVCVKAGNILSS